MRLTTTIAGKGSVQPSGCRGHRRSSVPKRFRIGSVLLAASLLVLLISATAQAQLTFGSPHEIEDSAGKWWAKALGDINGDGLLDVVVQDDNGNGGWLGWYETLPGGTSWTQHIIANTPPGGGEFASGDMEIADLDDDGDIDVLGFDHTGEWDNGGASTDIYWYENNGDGTVWTPHLIGQSPDFVKDVSIADFNLDGAPDIATVCFQSHTLTIFRQDSPTSWVKAKEFTVTNLHEGMDAGDIDGDGDPDLAPNGYWIENPGGDLTGTWTIRSVDTRWHSDPAGSNFRDNATKVFCQDITGDGRDEVFLSDSENAEPISWYGSADPVSGLWTEHVIANGYTYTHTLHVYDMDMDGDFDVVAGENGDQSSAGRLTVFVNGGDNLTWTEEVLTTDGSYNSLVGDIEGDGDMDIWRHPGHQSLLFELIPNETPPPILPLDNWERHLIDGSLPDKAVYILAGDLDGDGHKDLAAGGYWWRSSGTFDGTWTREPIGSPLNNVAVMADFDRDGDLDLFGTRGIGSASNHDFAWARNDGTGAFTVLTNIDTGGSGDFLQGVVLSDFGLGDQIALSWHNGGGGVQAVTIPSDPSSQTWSFSTLSPTTLKEDLSAGDIDDDGDTDLLLGTVWLRNEGGSWSAHTLGDISDLDGDAEPDRNDLADMDGDGDLDAVIGLENGTYLLWFEAPATPTNPWTRHVIESNVAGEGFSMDVADFDRDDDPDVVLGEHRGSAVNRVLLFENSSSGTSWATHEVDSDPTSVIDHHDGTQAVDLDYDGDLDLISLGWTNEKIWIFENRALTGGGNPPDNQAPSVPGNLHTTSVEARQIDLSWNASADNVGVTGYRIYRDGAYLRTVPSAPYEDSGLQPSTTYSYEVSAIDAAGNESGKSSPPVEATTLEAPPISETLIAAWSFDEGSGPTAFDYTLNNHDGTLENDPTWTTEGHYNGAIAFDGSNDYIDVGMFDLDATGVTISAWVRRGSCPTGDCRIVSKATGHQDQDHYFMLSLIGGNELRFRLKAGGSTTVLAGGNIPANTWTHVAATYDGTEMELFVDGNPVASTPKTGTINTSPSTPVWIGANPSDTYAPWGGIIDNLKIYGSALSQSEIQTDMNTAVGDPGLSLDVTVLLEGAYAGSGTMLANLAPAGVLPLDHPYDGAAWGYSGTESVDPSFYTTHPDIVDWLLVLLHSGDPSTSMTAVGSRAAFLLEDGSVIDTSGTGPVLFPDVSPGSYWIEVIHRNHLPVMSAEKSDFLSGAGSVDFTTGQDKAYGTDQMRDLGDGSFALIAGDADADRMVEGVDRSEWQQQVFLSPDYRSGDFNMNGASETADLFLWYGSNGASSELQKRDRQIETSEADVVSAILEGSLTSADTYQALVSLDVSEPLHVGALTLGIQFDDTVIGSPSGIILSPFSDNSCFAVQGVDPDPVRTDRVTVVLIPDVEGTCTPGSGYGTALASSPPLHVVAQIVFDVLNPSQFPEVSFDVVSIQDDAGETIGSEGTVLEELLPVELVRFEAITEGQDLRLVWETSSEMGISGFGIERSYDDQFFAPIGFVEGAGTVTDRRSYSFLDVAPGVGANTLYYRLRLIGVDGTATFSRVLEAGAPKPTEFHLEAAYPNPFTEQTTIGYHLPERQSVRLRLYDMLGRFVQTLEDGTKTAGRYEVVLRGYHLTSGTYFYRLEAGPYVATGHVMLAN